MLFGSKKDWSLLVSTPNSSHLVPNASGLAGSNLVAHPQRIAQIINTNATDNFFMFVPPLATKG
jgi:hypothetical protein